MTERSRQDEASARLAFPDRIPLLAAESIHLRELSERDIPAWFARATDLESADLAGDPVPASIEEGAAWLQRHRERFRERSAIRWGIVDNRSLESIGSVGLAITSHERRTADLGIVVNRPYWRKGVGTSALRLVTGYAFEGLGLDAIHAEALQRNVASVRLLETAGFSRLDPAAGAAQPENDSDACFFYVLRSASAPTA